MLITRNFSEEERLRLTNILQRLQEGEPLQYILGTAYFCGLPFHVTPATLIPRPETEELVDWAGTTSGNVLDAGTGSGCIAVAIAHRNPQAQVTAWDLSAEALEVAAQNAAANGVQVRFERHDMLTELPDAQSLDLIVSNPPYVCEREKAEMEEHVLRHEPATALFVPDNDPLRFYKALARIGSHALRPGGAILMGNQPRLRSRDPCPFPKRGLHRRRTPPGRLRQRPHGESGPQIKEEHELNKKKKAETAPMPESVSAFF